jgi:hypothetical protein
VALIAHYRRNGKQRISYKVIKPGGIDSEFIQFCIEKLGADREHVVKRVENIYATLNGDPIPHSETRPPSPYIPKTKLERDWVKLHIQLAQLTLKAMNGDEEARKDACEILRTLVEAKRLSNYGRLQEVLTGKRSKKNLKK